MSKMIRNPQGKPVAFDDLPAEAFPVVITAFVPAKRSSGLRQLWQRTIQPYVMVEIPEAPEEHKGNVTLKIELATGETSWQEPLSVEEAEAHIEQRIRESRG